MKGCFFMQNKTIDDYKREMLEAYAKRVIATPLPQYEISDETAGQGRLVVILTAARGAFPIKDGQIKIYKSGEDTILTLLRTDANGQGGVSLTAPKRSLSEAPGEESGKTYALYDIVATASGFEAMRINSVPVFDGVTSLQTVNMIALSAANGSGGTTEDTKNDYQL
jgi:hypothetical protein